MKDGSMAIAIGGGLLAILTAGIPILFLQKDEPQTKASKLASLEDGIGSMEGMEIMEEGEVLPTGGDDDESPPKQTANI